MVQIIYWALCVSLQLFARPHRSCDVIHNTKLADYFGNFFSKLRMYEALMFVGHKACPHRKQPIRAYVN